MNVTKCTYISNGSYQDLYLVNSHNDYKVDKHTQTDIIVINKVHPNSSYQFILTFDQSMFSPEMFLHFVMELSPVITCMICQ